MAALDEVHDNVLGTQEEDQDQDQEQDHGSSRGEAFNSSRHLAYTNSVFKKLEKSGVNEVEKSSDEYKRDIDARRNSRGDGEAFRRRAMKAQELLGMGKEKTRVNKGESYRKRAMTEQELLGMKM